MNIEKIKTFERAVCYALKLDGWNLEWCGDGYDHYDAKGLTPNGNECVIEMKFITKYYKTKILEKFKYDKLMELPDNIVKIYFVSDPEGNYFFWLNNLALPEAKEIDLPSTTLWNKYIKSKTVYFLEESQAVIINKNNE